MPARKPIQPDDKVEITLTAAERKLVLQDLILLNRKCGQIIYDTPLGKPVMMTRDELAHFCGCIAGEVHCCNEPKKRRKFDSLFQKVFALLEKHEDEEPPDTISIEDVHRIRKISDHAAEMLVAAEQLGVKSKPLEGFWLAPAQREFLLLIPSLPERIKNKLATEGATVTFADVAQMALALKEVFLDYEEERQAAILYLGGQLMDQLNAGISSVTGPTPKKKPKRKAKMKADVVYQFKITLLGTEPPIWRRIQVRDGTLDELNEQIQAAMGWTNSHLHEFKIKGKNYGDPELLEENFENFDCGDSTSTTLSDIVPKNRRRFAFRYKYDFGDNWEHEVLFEGCPPADKTQKCPVCLEGERACPPEDIGGVWGYETFLKAIADPDHERHDEFTEWAGPFDPEEFDPREATKTMRKGLSDWPMM